MTADELKAIKGRFSDPKQRAEWWPLSEDMENAVAEIERLQEDYLATEKLYDDAISINRDLQIENNRLQDQKRRALKWLEVLAHDVDISEAIKILEEP